VLHVRFRPGFTFGVSGVALASNVSYSLQCFLSVLHRARIGRLGYAVFRAARLEVACRRLSHGEDDRGHLVMLRGSLAAAGLSSSCLFGGNAGWGVRWDVPLRGSRLHDYPVRWPLAGNIDGSAPGPSIARSHDGWLCLSPCRSAPDRVRQRRLSTIRAALWIIVVLSGLSSLRRCRINSMKERRSQKEYAWTSAWPDQCKQFMR